MGLDLRFLAAVSVDQAVILLRLSLRGLQWLP
jgi:hypothetical protein